MFLLPPPKGVSPVTKYVPNSSAVVDPTAVVGDRGGDQQKDFVSPAVRKFVYESLSAFNTSLNKNLTFGFGGIASQVSKLTKDVENLYAIYNKAQEVELKEEKQETKREQLALQANRISMRERLIEGISSFVSAAATASQNVAKAAAKPIEGFLSKLAKALTLLASAWLIDNLPTIISSIEDMMADFSRVRKELIKELGKQRGWASAVGKMFSGMFNAVKKIGGAILKFTRWLGNKFFQLIGKVFRGVSNFVGNILRFIANKIGNLWNQVLKQASKYVPKPIKNVWDAVVGNSFVRSAGRATGNIVRGTVDVGKDLLKGDIGGASKRVTSGLSNAFSGLRDSIVNSGVGKPIKQFADSKGIKSLGKKGREQGLKKIFGPILSALGIPLKNAAGILSKAAKLPVVGVLVDVALNKAGGMGWMNSIINGLATGLAGAVGWKAGSFAGAAVGTPLAPATFGLSIPIGYLLGGIGGSIVAANLAEGGLNAVREGLGVAPTVRPGMSEENVNNIDNMLFGNFNGADKTSSSSPKLTISSSLDSFTNIPSTPEGMFSPDSGSDITFDNIELPPTTTKIKASKSGSETVAVEEPPILASTDDEMDPYRAMALQQFQLAY